ncbi:MAG: hypothetical protein HY315_00085 [Acidobacteria bacterium]|nr:hypothetical protein [Acidobacteriota bacterium]
MKKIAAFFLLAACVPALQAKIFVATPESFTLTTKEGLVLKFSNDLEGFTNNDAVVYLVVSGINKSQKAVRLAPDLFALTDESGSVIPGLSAREALKTVVDWNFERANGYVRIGDSDLRDVLRNESRRYTTDRELAEIILKPQQQIKEKVLFFPRLAKGRYALALGSDKVDIVISDGVYFARQEKPKTTAGRDPAKK